MVTHLGCISLGYYCPAGTGKDLKSCPRGTYGPEKGYYEVSQCKPCKAGMYCGQEHMMNVTTKCAPGHWCAYGVDRPQPVGRNITILELYNTSCPHYDGRETGFGGICPLATYCPEGLWVFIICFVINLILLSVHAKWVATQLNLSKQHSNSPLLLHKCFNPCSYFISLLIYFV